MSLLRRIMIMLLFVIICILINVCIGIKGFDFTSYLSKIQLKDIKSCAHSPRPDLISFDTFGDILTADVCRSDLIDQQNVREPCKMRRFAFILDLVDTYATKNNLIWFLACGNVIGAVREGGFIYHDHDMDIYFYIETDQDDINFYQMITDIINNAPCHFENENDMTSYNHWGRGGLQWGGVRLHCKDTPYVPNAKADLTKITRHWIDANDSISGRGRGLFMNLKNNAVRWASLPSLYMHKFKYGRHDMSSDKYMIHQRSGFIYTVSIIFPLNSCNVYGRIFPCPRNPFIYLCHTYEYCDVNWFAKLQKNETKTAKIEHEMITQSLQCLVENNWINILDTNASIFRPYTPSKTVQLSNDLCCLYDSCVKCLH